jgi:hypothetical protein
MIYLYLMRKEIMLVKNGLYGETQLEDEKLGDV